MFFGPLVICLRAKWDELRRKILFEFRGPIFSKVSAEKKIDNPDPPSHMGKKGRIGALQNLSSLSAPADARLEWSHSIAEQSIHGKESWLNELQQPLIRSFEMVSAQLLFEGFFQNRNV